MQPPHHRRPPDTIPSVTEHVLEFSVPGFINSTWRAWTRFRNREKRGRKKPKYARVISPNCRRKAPCLSTLGDGIGNTLDKGAKTNHVKRTFSLSKPAKVSAANIFFEAAEKNRSVCWNLEFHSMEHFEQTVLPLSLLFIHSPPTAPLLTISH